MRRRALLAAGLAAPWVARAQGAAAGWQATFAKWAGDSAVRQGNLVVMRQGRVVHASGLGGLAPEARMPVWSLSKFITGTAIAQLVAEGRVALEDSLGTAIPRTLAAARVPPDGPLGRLTLALLLSHRSGLPHRINDESVPGLRALIASRPPARIGLADVQANILAMRPLQTPGETHIYSNANFLLLGMVVAEQRGRAYAEDTAARILAPAGIVAARMDPDWHVLDSTGGWRLAPAEYLAFLRHVLGRPNGLPPGVAQWMRTPAGKETGVGSRVHYALGSFIRPVQGGANFFHTGSWSWRQETPHGLVAPSSGSRFAYAANGDAWCATYRPFPGDGATDTLDRQLWALLRTPAPDETGADQFPALLRAAA